MLKKLFSFSFFIISLGILLKVLTLNYYPDFSSYYYGSHAVFTGHNPYLGGKNFFTPFVYPPFVLLFFYPLSFFSFIIAEKIWVALSIICLFLSVILIFRIYKQPVFSSLSLVLFSLVFISFPVKFTLGMGQINLFILLFIVLFIYFFHKKREYKAGFFLVLSIALKLFPILLIFYLLFLRKWKILASCIGVMLSIIFITAICIRFEINSYFLQETLPGLLNSWKGDYYNQAFSGFLVRQISDISMREFLRVLIGAVFIIFSIVAILRKKKRDMFLVNLEISLLMTVSVLVNNFSWQHHFVWLVFPFFATFFYLKQKKLNVGYYCLLFLSYILVALNLRNPSSVPVIFQSHIFYGGLLLWGLDFFLLSRDKS